MPATTTKGRSNGHRRIASHQARGRRTIRRPTDSRRTTSRGRGSRPSARIDEDQLENLLLQAVETETGGIRVYETALRCADDGELAKEWGKYLEETRNHERILRDVFGKLGWDADRETPERDVVRRIGHGLVTAMEDALREGRKGSAQLVAAECVTLAETKDHLNWELIGECAKALDGPRRAILEEAFGEVEEQEDEHLYHTMGWCRELWLDSLGLPAVLPPPEERKHAKSAIGAARAKKGRARQAKRSTGAGRGRTKGTLGLAARKRARPSRGSRDT